MRLTVVGCAGSFPSPDSAASAYLVQADDPDGRTWNLLLDLGNGALGPLQRVCEPAEIDAIGLSHLHPDHVADICSLQVYLRYRPDAVGAHRRPPVPVYGPFGTASRLDQMCGVGNDEVLAEHLAVHAWQPGRAVQVGPLAVTPVAVQHPVPAYGVRVSGPAEGDPGRQVTLGYTGDTDSCAGLDEIARGVDVLLAEASFLEDRDTARGIHLTGRRAGQAAAAGDAGRLVLTHIPVWNPLDDVLVEAQEVYPGPIELASPGLVVAL